MEEKRVLILNDKRSLYSGPKLAKELFDDALIVGGKHFVLDATGCSEPPLVTSSFIYGIFNGRVKPIHDSFSFSVQTLGLPEISHLEVVKGLRRVAPYNEVNYDGHLYHVSGSKRNT